MKITRRQLRRLIMEQMSAMTPGDADGAAAKYPDHIKMGMCLN